MSESVINLSALEPLFAPHEEPNRHRARAQGTVGARIEKGRRPTPISLAQTLRAIVKEWRETNYPGVSETSRELLHHWFFRQHAMKGKEGSIQPFNYYFCQREAVETLIYLYEVSRQRSMTGLLSDYGGDQAETLARGVNPEDDRWAKYSFKLATGAGKTKVMSLAMVWSYFHALRESDSPMAQHFVVIAPNLIVFERLKEDFGNGRIFDNDPLIPTAWRGDWNLSVVLQDEASGAATGGTLYLTNIHRLYDPSRRRGRSEMETYGWMGPAVSRAKALDTGEALRNRITGHSRVMVLNDEAHHLWDPESAWNLAIAHLHDAISARGVEGVVAQLDFSATPKDNRGQIFPHVVCDTPLGEAVDAGIVKTPVIGRGKEWSKRPSKDASEVYQEHLMVGYELWRKSNEEWKRSGRKPLLFVMTENTDAADQITRRLNTDALFRELNGKAFNLHTNLKGKIKWVGGKQKGHPVFEESESEISDEDLKALRRLSRELDSGESPYQCIVSVLMLREGWDVRNVTTIVPLRPYTSKANILPEQTLGRGLRRMTQPGDVAEIVSVVEHPAFVSLYRNELEQQGLFIEEFDTDKVPRSTVTVFPDEKKNLKELDLVVPVVSAGHTRVGKLDGLNIEEVQKQFSRYQALPIGKAEPKSVQYEGRHLITDEIVQRMEIHLPLLQSGVGAVSYYREELEHIVGLRGTHLVLAPLLETFFTEMLFEEKMELGDERLLRRIGDADVRELVRATFVPLLLKRTTLKQERKIQSHGSSVVEWKPYQATHSAQHPALPAQRTPFNLVPCNQELEVAMCQFLDHAPDVAAFCKNAGPQALRVDFMTCREQLSLYTPDFLVRLKDGECFIIETKGRVDQDVPFKARAAMSWCKAATRGEIKWHYLYVPQQVFATLGDHRLETLVRACLPSLRDLTEEADKAQMLLPLDEARDPDMGGFIEAAKFEVLPRNWQTMIHEAVSLLGFLEKKKESSFAPIFMPLLGPLDDAAKAFLLQRLQPFIPTKKEEIRSFFEPGFSHLKESEAARYKFFASNARRTLVEHGGTSPIGLLRDCLEHTCQSKVTVGGFFKMICEQFQGLSPDIFEAVLQINSFRNTHVAHQKKPLNDPVYARRALGEWIQGLHQIWTLRSS